jgi:hypothetical protein
MTLATEIGLVKTEIATSLAASVYTAKDLVYVAKAIEALANAEGSTGIFTEATISTILYVGDNANDFEDTGNLTSPVAVFSKASAASSFAQLAFRNETSTSSTDIIAYMNNGDDSEGWVGMGIAGSAFDDTTYGITGPGDGYVFHNTKPGTGRKGNLVLATGDAGEENKLIFAAGGFADSTAVQMEITPGQNVHIEIATDSTSPSTGALTVVGGVGIQGDINIAGNVTFGGSGTTLETSTLAVADPLIFVGNNNTTDAVDLGLVAEYGTALASTLTNTITNKALTSNIATLTTGTTHSLAVGDIITIGGVDATFNGTYVVKAVPTTTTFTYDKTNANVTSAVVNPVGTTSATTKRRYAGVVRDASDGVIKAFKDATTKPVGSVNFSESGLAYADMRVAAITASSATIGSVTNTEIGYLSGVTSAIQTQLNTATTNIGLKANSASPTFTGNVVLPNTTVIGDVDATEIGYLNGVSSNVQTQIDAKLASATAATTYAPLIQTTSTPTFTSNNYTLVVGDKDKIVLASNSTTAGTVTVPSGVFDVGSVITLVQTGSGQLTLTASGTTINSQGGKLKFTGQYASCQLICTASNTFLAIGNLVS